MIIILVNLKACKWIRMSFNMTTATDVFGEPNGLIYSLSGSEIAGTGQVF